MITPDVCVLVDANRPSSKNHLSARTWLERALVADEPFGLWEIPLVAAYRLLTNPRVFEDPESPDAAIDYLNSIRRAPAVVRIEPGPRYWNIFEDLCRETDVRGDLTSDAMLAALAVEHRCRIATFDKDFAKFKGVRAYRPTP